MNSSAGQQRIAAALKMASDTRVLRLGRAAIIEAADAFRSCFGSASATIVADVNTFAVAGKRVADVLTGAGVQVGDSVVLDEPDLHAEMRHVDRLQAAIQVGEAIPVAVGSGTINDMTKLAAHRCNRGYLTVATAASMDGYTAYGASIIDQGSKQTFFCPAPMAVIADLDVIAAAPGELNAAGYADLLAKVPAGADWLLAEALGIEPIDKQAWSLVQDQLRAWVSEPDAIRRGDFDAIAGLIEGLLMTGFAMQWSKSSRPASGAEHQFSHLWDMQDHRYQGRVPYHGFKVGIGTIASTRLYEDLLGRDMNALDINAVCRGWPALAGLDGMVHRTHTVADLRTVAAQELKAKYVTPEQLVARLQSLQHCWPELQKRLRGQLIPAEQLRQMLQAAGAPYESGQIGIDLPRLRRSYIEAQQIRRRFTVLDLAAQTGLMNDCLNRLF